MLRILLLIPAFDILTNEMAMAWELLTEARKLHCTVICGTRDELKGSRSGRIHERRTNLEIFRVPRLELTEQVQDIVRNATFDAVFCAVRDNFAMARTLAARVVAPLILHDEYFFDDRVFLSRRYHGGFPPLRRVVSQVVRNRIHDACALVLSSDPKDFLSPSRTRYPRLQYLPWPHPGNIDPAPLETRNPHSSAFIGSISTYKGSGVLFGTIRKVLSQEPEFQWLLVGPLIDPASRRGLQSLLADFPNSVQHRERCSRQEALDYLRGIPFVVSPGKRWGWGLVGDAWTVGTPVLAHSEHYDLIDGYNCLACDSASGFAAQSRRLREDPELWNRLSAGGIATARRHTIDTTSDTLLSHLQTVIPAARQ
jgi:glycosyltransferase involved in cell wall biosynthesis